MGIQAPAFRELRFDRLGRSFGAAQALTRCRLHDPQGRVRRASRPLGLRQVDDAQHPRRPPAGDERRHLSRFDAHRHAAARTARLRHGVPELCALSAHERAQEHRLRPRHAPSAESGDRPEGRRGDRHGAARRPGGQAARPTLGRPAAARRHRASDRRRTAFGDDGRAAVEPRRQAEAGDARRDSPHPQRARGDDDLRHA